MATTASRSRVFLDVSLGPEPIGRIVIELFNDKTPKTCENFRTICTGTKPPLTYKASPFHRVIDEFMIQGGDITKGDGTGGESMYGGEFEDENIGWRDLDAANLVCMANRGKDTNSSQFFITLVPCPHLNAKHTVFGHVVSGQQTIDQISKVNVDDNDKPYTPVLISHCGELERRKKQDPRPTEQPSHTTEERGREKRRRTSSPSRSPSPSRAHKSHHHHRKHRHTSSRSITPPAKHAKDRRRSDATIDHNLRGRPRERSADRSRSPARDGTSPVQRHQRKRSPSPSRPRSPSAEHRRQRSLPNQYNRHDRQSNYDRHGRGRDEGRYRRRDEDMPRQEERRWGSGRNRFADPGDGRLGGGGGGGGGSGGGGGYDDRRDTADGDGIVYKGRGSMKYREKGRW
ncbi:hypothetical protein EJ05DRAFT_447487 [Pseudovirgaria hyperparasitica]|uniref:peptidylprolyl isomerase n=1 Tax=Pseudovirgaria hyperparasitica TaxID=470096 RepID=A0A6A6WLH0_9PEZI|nr:uncharacterized protein EJ05DRAFT_447487 [Pseudovirgaria hyperparasitica]KAF2763031.1 hypothetical protein EJ05DRAFT_447487 [Pseudovirgaria hyperparasitica]